MKGKKKGSDPTGNGGEWCIEGDAPLQQVLERGDAPEFLQCALVGPVTWQMRNEVNARRAATSPRLFPHWVATLLAVGASVVLDTDGGTEEHSLAKVLERESRTGLLKIKVPVGGSMRLGEAHVSRTPSDNPIVLAAATVELSDGVVSQARVALTGVWEDPVRLAKAAEVLVGSTLDDAAIAATAEAVEAEVAPQGDYLGSEEYRRAMAGVLTRRALERCQEVKDA